MSDLPFGFAGGDEGKDEGKDRGTGGTGGTGSTGGTGQGGGPPIPPGFGFPGTPEGLAGKMPLFTELQKLLSWEGGPVNWDLARQSAIQQVATGHRETTGDERQAVTDALRLADLWLDPVTTLPSGATTTEAWSRVQWVERTLPVWSQLCDPVAARVVDAMGNSLPEEAKQMAGPLSGVFSQIGGLMFGAQVGQALAQLSGEVLSATDVGLPVGPAGTAVLVPQNVDEFGTGLGRPADEVRLYLALREAAYHRLFGHVPWLRQRLLDTVDAYARGITVDTSALEQAISEVNPADPESMQRALTGGMFEPQTTPEQQEALNRLETLLALTEGWVDHVVTSAAADRLPGAAPLRETLRRRRASGGPAEQTFATLVGLQMRPRRLRDAAALWAALEEHRETAGRDAIWAHPDLLPSSEDLDDPQGFAATSEAGSLEEWFDEVTRGMTGDGDTDDNDAGGTRGTGESGNSGEPGNDSDSGR